MKCTECLQQAKAVADLLFPFVESVVHDLTSKTIAAIFNGFSGRKEGDPTPFHELNIDTKNFPAYFPPYYMHTIDGKKLKCVSLTICDEEQKPCFLICYNLDVTLFQAMEKKLSALTTIQQIGKSPLEIAGNDWQSDIRKVIDSYLEQENISLNNMTKQQKQQLVQFLYKKGAFQYKNAASFLTKVLKISKASLYNYLK